MRPDLLLLIGILSFGIYSTSLYGPLVYDDTDAVELNQARPPESDSLHSFMQSTYLRAGYPPPRTGEKTARK